MRLFRKRKHNYATCYKEDDLFWRSYCKIRICQFLRDNYNGDFDIEGTIELTDNEVNILYKWYIAKALLVLSSSDLYILTSIKMISDNRYNRFHLTFTKIEQ